MNVATAYIGLGSNLEDPGQQVLRAFRSLAKIPGTVLVGQSSLYRSAPWGDVNQPAFINAVAEVHTKLTPHELLRALHRIEKIQGRVRNLRRWGPRIIDLDLLTFGDLVMDEAGLTLPHPRISRRAFVLVPLAELARGLQIPEQGTIEELLANCDDVQDVQRVTP